MPNALDDTAPRPFCGVTGHDMDTGVDGCESKNLAWFMEAVGVSFSAEKKLNQSACPPATDGLTSWLIGVASTDIGVNPSKPHWLLERIEVRGMLREPCCISEKILGRAPVTGVESVQDINRTNGPRRGKPLEPQPLTGVPGQKFTGVVRPAGEANGELTGVAPALST